MSVGLGRCTDNTGRALSARRRSYIIRIGRSSYIAQFSDAVQHGPRAVSAAANRGGRPGSESGPGPGWRCPDPDKERPPPRRRQRSQPPRSLNLPEARPARSAAAGTCFLSSLKRAKFKLSSSVSSSSPADLGHRPQGAAQVCWRARPLPPATGGGTGLLESAAAAPCRRGRQRSAGERGRRPLPTLPQAPAAGGGRGTSSPADPCRPGGRRLCRRGGHPSRRGQTPAAGCPNDSSPVMIRVPRGPSPVRDLLAWLRRGRDAARGRGTVRVNPSRRHLGPARSPPAPFGPRWAEGPGPARARPPAPTGAGGRDSGLRCTARDDSDSRAARPSGGPVSARGVCPGAARPRPRHVPSRITPPPEALERTFVSESVYIYLLAQRETLEGTFVPSRGRRPPRRPRRGRAAQ